MKKEEAEEIFDKLMKETLNLPFMSREECFSEHFPEVGRLFREYLDSKIRVSEFIQKSKAHIQISDTKLYKALK